MTLAGQLLLDARRTGRLLPGLPPEAGVDSFASGYAVQDEILGAVGGHGGWKVGASSGDAEPVCAPLPRSGIVKTGAALAASEFGFIGIEVEIAFLLGRGLPARSSPYERSQVLEAVESVCAAIEIVDSRMTDWRTRSAFQQCADLCSHGALVIGRPSDASSAIDQARQRAELWADDRKVADRLGANTAGDVQRLLSWLANHAVLRGRPLRAGDIVTTGSCSGLYEACAGQRLRGVLPGVGEVEVSLI